MQTGFSLGENLVGFEVNDQGQPQVAFGRWKGEGETQEVDHLLTISEDCLLGMAIRGDGLPVVISENGHRVKLAAEELRQLRQMFVAAKAMLESYQAWLAEQAPRGCKVPDAREWVLSPRGLV